MKQTLVGFFVVTVLTGLLAALSFAVSLKGYPHGAVGILRLDAIANASTFMPLAALYAFAAMMIVILPLRAAGFLHANAASPLYYAALVLLATIVGLQAARFGFGDRGAFRPLLDLQFIFAAAIILSHQLLDTLRQDILLRTIGFAAFLAATLACLFWSFRL